jgi:hypothetical protein
MDARESVEDQIKSCLFCFCSTGAWIQGLHLEPFHQPFFCDGYFQDRVSQTISPGWLQTAILPISASWAAVITGMSYHYLAQTVQGTELSNAGHFDCEFEVGCVGQERLCSSWSLGMRQRSFSLATFLDRLVTGDQVMGQCACHVSVFGCSFFYSPRWEEYVWCFWYHLIYLQM